MRLTSREYRRLAGIPQQLKPVRLTATEHDEQVMLVEWLVMRGIRHAATPNGGVRNRATAGKLRAEGVSSGFPDITVFPSRPDLPILFIEMKRRAGGRLRPEQRDWLEYLNSLAETGAHRLKATVANGFDEAREYITANGY